MSEVVPLPSFGEVFFDARGQDRVLRVTWHDGTLVLSLWRGEMCTASFRMPMADVERLIDTLDEGLAAAGGGDDQDAGTGPIPRPDEHPEGEYSGREAYEPRERAPSHRADYPGYPDYPDYPGTGQYARPPAPNDVLVARGTPAPQDRLVATAPQQPAPHRPAPQPPVQSPSMPQPAVQQPTMPQPTTQQPPVIEVDPNDPLGLGPVRPYRSEPARPSDPSYSSYAPDSPYSTGERLRPEHRGDEQRETPGW